MSTKSVLLLCFDAHEAAQLPASTRRHHYVVTVVGVCFHGAGRGLSASVLLSTSAAREHRRYLDAIALLLPGTLAEGVPASFGVEVAGT